MYIVRMGWGEAICAEEYRKQTNAHRSRFELRPNATPHVMMAPELPILKVNQVTNFSARFF